LLGPGPRLIKKNNRVAVSQRLRNTGLGGTETVSSGMSTVLITEDVLLSIVLVGSFFSFIQTGSISTAFILPWQSSVDITIPALPQSVESIKMSLSFVVFRLSPWWEYRV
jgi:hypothetical protein